ncbi:MAG: hypothetical protein L0Z52_10700 [Acidobacteria bacterium]|nr:hypothetical protein [Acidobacteriota bacterium]
MRRGRRMGRFFILSALAGLAVTQAWPVSTQTWKNRTRSEREQGDLNGVSLKADGTLTLGPAFETLASAADPYIWSLARDSKGTLYAGSGNDGKVYRLSKGGKLENFFDSPELEVHALALDAKDNLYVGTSPRGKIYRLSPSGKAEEFFSPDETYIWSLLFDGKGNLFAGTGTQGRIYKISPAGKGEIFLDTDETHVRVLAEASGGDLLAGTDGKGMVLRVEPAGKSQVLTTSPLPEVTALVTGNSGRVYFAAAGQSSSRAAQRPAAAPAPPRPAQGQAAEEERIPGQPPAEPPAPQPPAQPQPAAAPAPQTGAGVESKILALEMDGYTREIWSQPGELILSLAMDRDGQVIAGGGTDGKIYLVDPIRSESTLLEKADSSQVSALLKEPDGSVLAAGSNLGAVYRLGGRVASEGSFESTTFDTRVYSTWGKMSWRDETPSGTSVSIQVRTGNTSEPDSSWSEWSAPYKDREGSLVERPGARFVQWKATLKSGGGGKDSPRLGQVDVTYLQRNLPPELKSVDVQAPGTVFQKPNRSSSSVAVPGEGASAPGRGDRDKAAHHPTQQPRPQSDPEGRAAQWGASDPNGDDLVYSVYYRGADERQWKLMEKDLTDSFFSWDATSLADGTYLLRVVAADSPSNPEGAFLSAERLSDPFDVDNNPPQIGPIQAAVSGSGLRMEFEVQDSFSDVGEVVYSVNAQEWELLPPADGLTDSPREAYRLVMKDLEGGELTVVVKANDAAGNSATSKKVVQIGAPR